jgi:hypothetical protein
VVLRDRMKSDDGCVAVTSEPQSQVSPLFQRHGFARPSNKRYLAAILLSVVLLVIEWTVSLGSSG